MDRITVALWAADELEAEGLQQIIASTRDMRVCCSQVMPDSANWAQNSVCSHQQVDAALILQSFRWLDQMVPVWRNRYPSIPVVAILKEPWHWSHIVRLLHDDVSAITSAENSPAILSMIRLAVHHTGGVDGEMVQQMLAALQKAPAERRPSLTPRDFRIWELMAQGWSNPQIAAYCDLSLSQVKRSVRRVFQYLGVHHRGQAIALYSGKDLENISGIAYTVDNPVRIEESGEVRQLR